MKCFEYITPEQAGISSKDLAEVVRGLNGFQYLNSMIMLRHGKIFYECTWPPYSMERPHALWSLSKSFTSCAIGIAQQEGRLTVKDRLTGFFPEYEACITDEKMKKITLQDLLTMRSGHAACASTQMKAEESGCWVKGFLSSKLEFEPGTRFVYNSGATYMLSAVLRKVTGMTVREYLLPRLFRPMGMTPGIWETCPEGTPCGGWGLYLTTKDLAKFAQMILNKGVWQGKQIVPEEYLAEATAKQADNSMNLHPDWKCGYGYQFWKCRHGFRGDGASGQYALMIPEYDMAIAVNSCMGDMGRVLDLFWEKLLPALKSSALPADPEGEKTLAELTASLAIPPLAGNTAKRADNKAWNFAENQYGIRSMSLEFGDDECSLTFFTDHGPQQIRAGFGRHLESVIRIQDTLAHPVASSAAWTEDGKLKIQVLFIDSTFRDTFTLDLNDSTYPVRWTAQCTLFRPLFPLLRSLQNSMGQP